MNRFYVCLFAFGLASAFAAPLSAKELFKAKLRGDNEFPTPVVTDTSGKAFFRLNKSETKIEFTLRVKDGVDVIAAHIHCGMADATGDIVVFLAGLHDAGLDVDGKWISKASFDEGSIVDPDCGSTIADLAQSMRDGDTYVNVHTVANGGGEVRGQIMTTKSSN